MHITGGTRYQRLLKEGRLRRRKVATNEDPTNAQPTKNIASPGEELKLMFIFASSINKVIKIPMSPRGMASTKQTTRASTGDLAATGESTQSVFIAVSKSSFLAETLWLRLAPARRPPVDLRIEREVSCLVQIVGYRTGTRSARPIQHPLTKTNENELRHDTRNLHRTRRP